MKWKLLFKVLIAWDDMHRLWLVRVIWQVSSYQAERCPGIMERDMDSSSADTG